MVYVIFHIDDNLLICCPEAIKKTVEQFQKNGLALKVVDRLQDYLPCDIMFSDNKKKG